MPKAILVPVDFSKTSDHAVDHALRLARESKGKMVLLHVISDSALMMPAGDGGGAGLLLDYYRIAEENAQKAMKELVQRKRLRRGQYRSFILRGGDPARVVASQAKKVRASLIVMGSHGRTGLQRFVLGSVAERTLRYAGCPVLIVKK